MSDNLPQGWAECTLGDIIKIQNGYAFPSKEFRESGIPLIRQGNLAGERVSLEKCVYLEPRWLGVKPDFILRKNDVLIGMSGSVGKLCIYNRDEPALQNQRTGKIVQQSTEFVDWRFIWEYLKTVELQLLEKGKGLGVLNVSATDIESLPFRLAPFNEQRRIAAKLEKLLGKVDACQHRLPKILTQLKRFRQSVLAAACSGRLTADWREDNPTVDSVVEILNTIRIRREAAAKVHSLKEKIRHIYEASEENNSNELPESWQFFALNKLCVSFDYGTSAKSQPSGKVPVLRMGNIQNGKLDWDDLVYTSDADEIQTYSLKPYTVLFNRTNSPELVGKTAIYRGEHPAIFAGYLIRINTFAELDPQYLNLCLNTSYAKEFFLHVKTDGVSQSNINAQKLGTFEVPFCNPDEQQEIVRRVDALFALADQIEARFAKAKAHVDQLTQSLLAKAFHGELVPQDPNNEPASVLLERIKAERAKVETEREGGGKKRLKVTRKGKGR